MLHSRIDALVARGLTDRQIASRCRATPTAVRAMRYRKHLVQLPNSPHRKAAWRKAIRKAARNAGADSLAQHRHSRGKLQAIAAGWPAGTTAAQAVLLGAIAADTLTLRQLASRLRRRRSSAFYAMVRTLIARGLIVPLAQGRIRLADNARREL